MPVVEVHPRQNQNSKQPDSNLSILIRKKEYEIKCTVPQWTHDQWCTRYGARLALYLSQKLNIKRNKTNKATSLNHWRTNHRLSTAVKFTCISGFLDFHNYNLSSPHTSIPDNIDSVDGKRIRIPRKTSTVMVCCRLLNSINTLSTPWWTWALRYDVPSSQVAPNWELD